jgi:hypothetical protein
MIVEIVSVTGENLSVMVEDGEIYARVSASLISGSISVREVV